MASDNQKEEYRQVAGIVVIRDKQPQGTSENGGDDIHSITRKPSEKLFLLVKKDRADNAWMFPQGGIKKKKKETVAQGALRELYEECGDDLKVALIDAEPACSYQYRYPAHFIQKKKRNFAGSQVHFVRSNWLSGQCKPDGVEIVDFAWLTRSEVMEFVSTDFKLAIDSLIQ
ncbi:hypothetical protein K501DRAFT_262475 [Backusella circina FSU 941]|nr:hypothetical protein K501DRAFT_262475 [Backusella circina FSU 941]